MNDSANEGRPRRPFRPSSGQGGPRRPFRSNNPSDRPRRPFRSDDRRDDRRNDGSDRPRRFDDRGDRPRRFDDGPRRFDDDRPRRYDRSDGSRRRFDDGGERSQRYEGGQDRPRRYQDRDDRPRRFDDRSDRPRRFDRTDGDRPRRFDRTDGDRPRRFQDRDDRPRRFDRTDGDRPRRFQDRDDRPRRFDDRPRRFDRTDGDRPRRFQDRDDRPRRFSDDRRSHDQDRDQWGSRERGGRDRDDMGPDRRLPRDLTPAPEIPDWIEPDMLEHSARKRLLTLSEENAEGVARHLAATYIFLDRDPELAYQHARAAVNRAARVDVVREAAGIAAYRTGRYAEALRELRAVRRLSGSDEHIAIMADCERGLGRPERALDLGVQTGRLPWRTAVEMGHVIAGARMDLGQPDAALLTLESVAAAAARDPELAWRHHQILIEATEKAGRDTTELIANAPPEPPKPQVEEPEIVAFDLESLPIQEMDDNDSDFNDWGDDDFNDTDELQDWEDDGGRSVEDTSDIDSSKATDGEDLSDTHQPETTDLGDDGTTITPGQGAAMTLLASPEPLADAFDVALVDLDGTAFMGANPIEHAAPSLNEAAARMPVVYVTNNASRSPQTVADHLAELDIHTSAEQVLTAAMAGAAMLHQHAEPGANILVIGGEGLLEAVKAEGFVPVHSATEEPAAVIQGFHPSVDWAQLAEATYAIRAGAPYIATNLDSTLPTERGFAPGNGSLVAAVISATGVTPPSPGKPAPTMMHLVAERGGYTRPLVVGDRLNTDIAGGNAAGYPVLMVLTGVNSARDAILAIPAERPSFISADLRGLLEPHEAPHLIDGWWTLGEARARIVDDRLELEGDTSDINAVRVAAAAVWSHGGTVDESSVPEFEVTS